MADYTTLADVKAQIPESGLNTTTDYDAAISGYITTASRLIDGYLGVPANYFSPSTDGETRYYNGTNDYEICIDPFLSISALGVSLDGGVNSTDYTAYDSTDYYFEPYNAAANGKPYSKIVLDVINSTKDPFPNYRKAVKVTAIFGYSAAIPDLIAQACKTQAVQWYMRGKSAWQNTGANEAMLTDTGGDLSRDVKNMLHSFMLDRL
jgi:hypothetical protein